MTSLRTSLQRLQVMSTDAPSDEDSSDRDQRGVISFADGLPSLQKTPAPRQDRLLLSIVVPAHNEERTIEQVVRQLMAVQIGAAKEIIVVDDGSVDETSRILERLGKEFSIRAIAHEKNQGKGQAVRAGIETATGTHLLIFDADSEYDASDISALMAPIISGRAEVVFGTRVRGYQTLHPSLIHAIGNSWMTFAANLIYGSAISDLHTCLKLLPLGLLRSMKLTEKGFGLDTEITAELLRAGYRPFEVPVSYIGRSKEEGKHIGLSDAVRCLVVLLKVRFRGYTKYGNRDLSLLSSDQCAQSLKPVALGDN